MTGRIRNADLWLVVRQKNYSKLAARLATTKPSLKPGEVPVKLRIEIPDSVFSTPHLFLTVQMTEPNPSTLDFDVVSEAVTAAVGMSVVIAPAEVE